MSNSANRFCAACPRKLSKIPDEPCPRALERIYAQQSDAGRSKSDPDALPGCPWALNSAEFNYCFWSYATQLDEPVPDREICNLLGISQQMLDKTLKSAISKLQDLRGTDVMDGFVETVMEIAAQQNPDNTVYLPDSYSAPPETLQPGGEEEPDEDAKLVAEVAKKPRKGYGMPVHRSGDRIDIFGLYSKKALEKAKNAKK